MNNSAFMKRRHPAQEDCGGVSRANYEPGIVRNIAAVFTGA